MEKVYGFSPGIIGSGRFELDSPIVIGNTQTLYRNIEKIRKEFGTIILDEMHHVSSPTFAKIIDVKLVKMFILHTDHSSAKTPPSLTRSCSGSCQHQRLSRCQADRCFLIITKSQFFSSIY